MFRLPALPGSWFPLCWPCCVSFLLREEAGLAGGDGLEAQNTAFPEPLCAGSSCCRSPPVPLAVLLPSVEPCPGSLDLWLPSNLRIFFQSMNLPGCLTLVDVVPRPSPST